MGGIIMVGGGFDAAEKQLGCSSSTFPNLLIDLVRTALFGPAIDDVVSLLRCPSGEVA
jgi:hypothetical protein